MRFFRLISVLSVSIVFTAIAGGCGQPAPAEHGESGSEVVTVNAFCPMMGGEVSAEANTVEVERQAHRILLRWLRQEIHGSL